MRNRSKWLAFGLPALAMGIAILLLTQFNKRTSCPPTSEWRNRLWDLQAEESRARESENWRRSEVLLAEILQLLPSDPVSHYARAYALVQLNRAGEAIKELREAVELGWVDLEGVNTNPMFTKVRDHSDYGQIADAASRIANEGIAIYIPSNMPAAGPCPLVVAFHGLGENPHRHLRFWQQAADQSGVVVVAPCGIKRMPDRRVLAYRWDPASDMEKCAYLPAWRESLIQAIEFAKLQAPIDEDRILLAGYSQGGVVALRLLADRALPLRGALLQAPSYSKNATTSWAADAPSVRVMVFVHEFDQLRPLGEQAHADLENLGVESRQEVVVGSDHEVPLDNSPRLIRAIQYLLDDSSHSNAGAMNQNTPG